MFTILQYSIERENVYVLTLSWDVQGFAELLQHELAKTHRRLLAKGQVHVCVEMSKAASKLSFHIIITVEGDVYRNDITM